MPRSKAKPQPGKTRGKPGPGRPIILFTACSLDGFIAESNGGIGWLFQEGDYGYAKFFASVDAVLLGRKTFDQALSFSSNPFESKPAHVFTRSSDRPAVAGAEYIHSDPAEFARSLKSQPGDNIWLVGGGEINGQLMRAGLVDEIVASIHPVILGAGRPLFGMVEAGVKRYALVKCKTYPNGLAQLTYRLADDAVRRSRGSGA